MTPTTEDVELASLDLDIELLFSKRANSYTYQLLGLDDEQKRQNEYLQRYRGENPKWREYNRERMRRVRAEAKAGMK